jgi:thioesterase domain-containing protein
VPADASFTGTEQLRDYMRARLPQYMVPAALVLLERLPLTPNGKIDRRALPVPSAAFVGAHRPQVAPRDNVEQSLCTIWAETLGVERVSLDDNFFELGGHSLLAAILFGRLDRVFGRSLPLATLFEAPTIRELARFYRDEVKTTVYSVLVPITTGGSLPPVFAVPGVGGNVLGYADLARELGQEQPFYGLSSVGLDGAHEPLESIEEMAAHCLTEVRQLQPVGPYTLLGACFGATVAFEMSRQLADAGETVAFLGLLDPSLIPADVADWRVRRLPRKLKRGLALGRFVVDRLGLYWKEIRAFGFREKVIFVGKKLQLLGEASQQRDLFRGDWREFYQHRVYEANLTALRRYKREPLRSVPAAFEIFATKSLFERPSKNVRLIWGPLAGGCAIYHQVAGKDSGDMIQGDNAKPLAAILSNRLQHVRRTRIAEERPAQDVVRAPKRACSSSK